MTQPSSMGSTSTLERTEIDPTTGEPRLAHMVAPKDGKDGATQIMEARIEGTSVKALCGHVLVPTRDPGNYPNCQACIEIFESRTGAQDGWKDA